MNVANLILTFSIFVLHQVTLMIVVFAMYQFTNAVYIEKFETAYSRSMQGTFTFTNT